MTKRDDYEDGYFAGFGYGYLSDGKDLRTVAASSLRYVDGFVDGMRAGKAARAEYLAAQKEEVEKIDYCLKLPGKVTTFHPQTIKQYFDEHGWVYGYGPDQDGYGILCDDGIKYWAPKEPLEQQHPEMFVNTPDEIVSFEPMTFKRYCQYNGWPCHDNPDASGYRFNRANGHEFWWPEESFEMSYPDLFPKAPEPEIVINPNYAPWCDGCRQLPNPIMGCVQKWDVPAYSLAAHINAPGPLCPGPGTWKLDLTAKDGAK